MQTFDLACRWLLPLLADAWLKGIVLLALAGAASWLLRRRSAALRHLVWSLALTLLLLLPAAALSGPRWTLSILPSPRPTAPRSATDRIPVSVPARSVDSLPMAHSPAATGPAPALETIPQAAPNRTPLPARSSGSTTGFSPRHSTSAWIVLVWLVGLLVGAARWGTGRWAAARLASEAQPADGKWRELLDRLRGELGLRRPVRLFIGGRAPAPMTWGWRRPVVLLPKSALDWPDERRRAVLAHELAHVARRDCLAGDAARLAAALHWPNPLAWLALGRLMAERERACDDRVLLLGARPSAYAGELVAVAREMGRRRSAPVGAIAMARPGSLEGRVREILSPTRDRRGVGRRASVLGVLLALTIATPLAMVALAAEDDGARARGPAYENAPGSKNLSMKVGPNRFRIQGILRNDRNGLIQYEDGFGKSLENPNPEIAARMIKPSKWMDIVNIELGVDPRGGMDPSLLYDIMEVRVFNHATRELLASDINRSVGWELHGNHQLQIQSLIQPLPAKIDVWLRVNSYESTADRILLVPKPGTKVSMNDGKLAVSDVRDGRWGYSQAPNGPIIPNFHFPGFGGRGTTFILDWQGKWLVGPYQICLINHDGQRSFPDEQHFIDFSKTENRQIIQCTMPLTEVNSIEMRPFGERRAFYFDGVNLPKVGKFSSAAPGVRFDIQGQPITCHTDDLNPIKIDLAVERGTINVGGVYFEPSINGEPTPENLSNFLRHRYDLKADEGFSVGWHVGGLEFTSSGGIDLFDRNGHPLSERVYYSSDQPFGHDKIAVRGFQIPLDQIGSIVIRPDEGRGNLVAADTIHMASPVPNRSSVIITALPQFAIYRVQGEMNATDAAKMPLADLPLESTPFLSDRDIVSYDWPSQAMGVKQEVAERFPKQVSLRGVPFVVMAGGERIYPGAFWSLESSFAPHLPVIIQPWRLDKSSADQPLPVRIDWTGSVQHGPGAPSDPPVDPRPDPRIRAALEKAGVALTISAKQPDAPWLTAFRQTSVTDPGFSSVAFKTLVAYREFLESLKDPLSDDPGYPTHQQARTADDWKALETTDYYLYRAGYADFLGWEFWAKVGAWWNVLNQKKETLRWTDNENYCGLAIRALDDGRLLLGPRMYPELCGRFVEQTAPQMLTLLDWGLELYGTSDEDQQSHDRYRDKIAVWRAQIVPQLKEMLKNRVEVLAKGRTQ